MGTKLTKGQQLVLDSKQKRALALGKKKSFTPDEFFAYRDAKIAQKKSAAKKIKDAKARKKAAGPRSSPKLQSAAYASKKASAKKTAATKRRVASGPKSNPTVRSSAYYARKRAAAKKK